jgi:transposase
MTATADTLVPEQLWQTIQPLLPTPPRRYGGRPRIDDRAALAGIVYQLRTGIPWRLLPTGELGCGSPVTCWRRLRDWQCAGVWQRLHHSCWSSSAGRVGWTGRAPAWTRSACAPSGGPGIICVMVDQEKLRARYELHYLGNGPGATSGGRGWRMSPTLFLKCPRCSHLISADPTTTETCPCGALHKDADAGRVGSSFGDVDIEVFEAIPR